MFRCCGPIRFMARFGNQQRLSRLVWLLTMGLLFGVGTLLPSRASAAMFQTAGPTFFGDDLHSSTLSPYGLKAVSSITYGDSALNGQCVWINSALNAFIAANPNDGKGPTGQAWAYSWAGVAMEAKVESGITVLDYYP